MGASPSPLLLISRVASPQSGSFPSAPMRVPPPSLRARVRLSRPRPVSIPPPSPHAPFLLAPPSRFYLPRIIPSRLVGLAPLSLRRCARSPAASSFLSCRLCAFLPPFSSHARVRGPRSPCLATPALRASGEYVRVVSDSPVFFAHVLFFISFSQYLFGIRL